LKTYQYRKDLFFGNFLHLLGAGQDLYLCLKFAGCNDDRLDCVVYLLVAAAAPVLHPRLTHQHHHRLHHNHLQSKRGNNALADAKKKSCPKLFAIISLKDTRPIAKKII
jgi:hypothetical protein